VLAVSARIERGVFCSQEQAIISTKGVFSSQEQARVYTKVIYDFQYSIS
jgi:hypothetical protein